MYIVERLRSIEHPNPLGIMWSDECELAAAAADEIERLNKCLKYEQHRAERIGTHGQGCWSWGPQHYECALREIEALRKDAARYRYLRSESRREALDKWGPAAGCWIDSEDEHHNLILLTGEDADEAIDTAMETMNEYR